MPHGGILRGPSVRATKRPSHRRHPEGLTPGIAPRFCPQSRLDVLRARKDKLVEAYLDGTIEKLVYQEHAAKIDTDLAEARVSLTEATGGEIDIEAVLAFAEQVLGDPGALWRSLPAAKKVRLQSAIFPEGLAWDRRSYRTAVTSQAFAACADLAAGKGEWCPRGDSNTRHAV